MEIDIIIFRDGLYSLYPLKVEFAHLTDCFDYCDELRARLTTYIESINRHIIKDGKLAGAQFFGCSCR
tara:strand:+ start:1335 stop:1538 length:204 start_codon:yes stop_codon:yes gene_type:complete